MAYPRIDELYPQQFSLKIDALMWLGMFMGALSAVSAESATAIIPTSYWQFMSIGLYIVAGALYAPRADPFLGPHSEFWITLIQFVLPLLLVLALSGLLSLAGVISAERAVTFSDGAFFHAIVGIFAFALTTLVCWTVLGWIKHLQS